jgi:magnesium-transporting ATPase (P-type)
VSAIVRLEKGVDWAEGLSVLLTIQFSILVSVFNNLHKVHIFKKLTKNYEQLQRVTVVRDGSEMLIHPTDLVVGDVCLIDTY